MAHKKAGSSSKNGRDSVGQRLGVKAGDGQLVTAGSIIVRQRGQTFLSGPGTGLGHDYTVFATTAGHVRFEHATKSKKRIRVISADEVAAASIRAANAEAATEAKRAGKAERAAGRATNPAAPKRRSTKTTTDSASAEA
jgi:large subunit ribosomal protein L27